MRKSVSVISFFILILPLLLAAKGATMSVQVKITQMRNAPSFTGAVLATLEYAEQLNVLEVRGAWIRCAEPRRDLEGWVHLSALSARKIVLSAGSETKQGVDTSEVALAGKGFNSTIESEYRKEKGLDYTWVDRMEEFEVPVDECLEFLKYGGLEGEKKK